MEGAYGFKALLQCSICPLGFIGFSFVDLPPGTGDIHLSLIQSIPLMVLSSLVRLKRLLWPMHEEGSICLKWKMSKFR